MLCLCSITVCLACSPWQVILLAGLCVYVTLYMHVRFFAQVCVCVCVCIWWLLCVSACACMRGHECMHMWVHPSAWMHAWLWVKCTYEAEELHQTILKTRKSVMACTLRSLSPAQRKYQEARGQGRGAEQLAIFRIIPFDPGTQCTLPVIQYQQRGVVTFTQHLRLPLHIVSGFCCSHTNTALGVLATECKNTHITANVVTRAPVHAYPDRHTV